MSEFVFLYRRPPATHNSPQKMQERMERWMAWFKGLEAGGHVAAKGHPLGHSGGAVVRDAKGSLTDGPYAETKDIVIGYSLIEARDLEQAVSLSAGWPGFDEGGVLEIRPVLKM